MLGVGIGICVDCCAADSQIRGCTAYSKSYLAAVGYEDGSYGFCGGGRELAVSGGKDSAGKGPSS